MRTTLDIDDDVLAEAKRLAAARKTHVGRIISDLVRQGLTAHTGLRVTYRNGFFVLPKRGGGVVTPELVDRLAEDDFQAPQLDPTLGKPICRSHFQGL
jgi:hypothetical protein